MSYQPTVQAVLDKRKRNDRALFSVDEIDALLVTARRLTGALEKAFKTTADGKDWCEYCGCEWGKCNSKSGCFCDLVQALDPSEPKATQP